MAKPEEAEPVAAANGTPASSSSDTGAAADEAKAKVANGEVPAKGARAASSRAPAAKADPVELKPATAAREDNLTYDLKHMAAYDISPLNPKTDLLSYTRDSVQLLLNKMFALPRVEMDVGTAVTLPTNEVFQLPRQKPIPKAKPPTRWQKFMDERNIRKRKRSKLVFDDISGDWLPRWGYKSAKKSEESTQWFHEVKSGDDPRENPFEKASAEKRLIAARQKMREVRNKVEAAGGKLRASVPDLQNMAKRGKEGLREAVKRAQVSSASYGKFDRVAPNEATNLQPKQRKVVSSSKPGDEKERYIKAATRVLASDGSVDRAKAAKAGKQAASSGGGGGGKGGGKGGNKSGKKRRSKQGGKKR